MSLASWDETGALVLGHMELRGKWLVLEVNSSVRAERGQQMLTALLGGLVEGPLTETQSVESALEEPSGRKRGPARDVAPQLSPEEAARVMTEFLDRHYRRVIDEPLPALGNVSPREAVRTAEGRKKVVGWLKYLENGESRRPGRRERHRTISAGCGGNWESSKSGAELFPDSDVPRTTRMRVGEKNETRAA